MSLDRCLVLAWAHRASDRAELIRRVERLARWHGGRASWVGVGDHGVAGAVRYDDREERLDQPLVFGEPLPPALRATSDLLGAEPGALRAIEGASAALAVEADRARLVAGAAGPGMLFATASGTAAAWSTHAVAAAWLAHGRVQVDAGAIPEQLAAEFVGGGRALVQGDWIPLADGTDVVFEGGNYRSGDYWRLPERWEPVPEDQAAVVAERHLLDSLGRRAGKCPHVSLTAGLDSRVAAVALREVGIDARGFTWGEREWEDVGGGAELAARLGIPHELAGIQWLSDEEATREVRRQVRWNEGAIHVGFGRVKWPGPMAGFVTGAGGELGRAFYYRDRAPATEDAEPEQLTAVLVDLLAPRLAGARPEAVERLAASVRGWVDDAARAGLPGWRTLDVVYGEQRVRRWLRGMLPRLDAPMIPAFATPEIGRALASLPLAERLSDGFHRGFLERHAPDLVPLPAPPPSRGLRDRLPGRLRARLASPLGERWREHPEFRAWIANGVLGSPLVTEPLGERWAARTRRRFLAGDAHAEGLALAAGGPVALAEALEELNRDG